MVRMLVLGVALAAVGLGQSERWVFNYDGPTHSHDEAKAVAVGGDGSIYAAGSSSGSTGADATVIGLYPDSTPRWLYRYDGPSHAQDYFGSVIYGSDANVYATGASQAASSYNLIVASIAGGSQNWVYTYDGAGTGSDEGRQAIWGADGNLYIGGYTSESGWTADMTVISLTPNNVVRWIRTYDGPAHDDDEAMALAYGDDGNIYAAGWSSAVAYDHDLTVISLTRDDSLRWVYTYQGPGRGNDEAWAMCYGGDGNIYAAGKCTDSTGHQQLIVVSLTPEGGQRWVYRYVPPVAGYDQAWSVLWGADGNVYVGGECTGGASMDDIVVISLTPGGGERWVYRYNGSGNNYDGAYSMCGDRHGNIYAGGYSYGAGPNYDLRVVSVDTGGTERWAYRYSGPPDSGGCVRAIACGSDLNVYAAGTTSGRGTMGDFTVVSLTSGAGIAEPGWTSKKGASALDAGTVQGRTLSYCLSLAEPAKVELSLYDLRGRRLALWRTNAGLGQTRHSKYLPELVQGVYFLWAAIPDRARQVSRKLVVARP